MQLIGSLIFTVFLFAWTFFYAIFFVIACSLLPFRKRFDLARVWGLVLLWALKWTCRLDYRIEGRENLPPGNHIALWKHSSSWETIAMAVVFPRQVWVLKRELTWIPFVGWGIRQLARHRHRSQVRAFRRAPGARAGQAAAGRGRLDHDLPRRHPHASRADAKVRRQRHAAGVESGKLMVPVAHNAGSYWPRRGLIKRPGTIRVRIGRPCPRRGATPGRSPRSCVSRPAASR